MKIKTIPQFAELAGVSRIVIYNLKKTRLKPSVKKRANRFVIDIHHPSAVEDLQEKGVQIREGVKRHPTHKTKYNKKGKQKAKEEKELSQDQENLLNAAKFHGNGFMSLEEIENMTVKELAIKFTGAPGLKSYVEAIKALQDYRNKEIITRKKRGELIERKAVADGLFFIVDIAFKRLVEEYPESAPPQIIALVQSNVDNLNTEVTKLIRSNISKILQDCKKSLLAAVKKIERDL